MPQRKTRGKWIVGVIASVALVSAALFGVLDSVRSSEHKPVHLAIIDGGANADHPAFEGVGFESILIDGVEAGSTDHGTAMASIALAAFTREDRSAAEIRISSFKALNNEGFGTADAVAAAVTLATESGAQVILCSLAIDIDSPALQTAIAQASSRGIIVVASAGNGLGEFETYPASYESVVSVGALDSTGDRLYFTNRADVTILAPGEEILGAVRDGGYGSFSGTSPAAAAVSGYLSAHYGDIDSSALASLQPNSSLREVSKFSSALNQEKQ